MRAVAEAARPRSLDIERAGVVPTDLIEQLEAAGAFRLFVPQSLGGLEVDPTTVFEVIEALAVADGSLGWTAFVLNGAVFACWLEPAVAAELLATRPGGGIPGTLGPIGRARPEDGALRLQGRFPFNSGAPHAAWFVEGGLVVNDDGVPRTRPDGQPDWRLFFLPPTEVEILDTWHVAGLRATASHDVVVEGALVPEERTACAIFDEAPQDAAIFRWPLFSIVSPLISGVLVGIARRALDEFAVLATTKSRRSSTPLAETEAVALTTVRDEGRLRAARALLLEAYGRAWDTALAGDRLQTDDRIAIRTASFHAARTAVEVVDSVFAQAGGGALYDSSPLQRCWRDVHAGSHHIYYCNHDATLTGRSLLTGATPDWII